MTGTPRIRTLLFSTLYPSSVRPTHGIFVETRLRELLSSRAVETKVVAPVPWFFSQDERYGEYARFAQTPGRETHNGVDVLHPRYLLLPKVGMTMAPLTLALGALPAIRQILDEKFDFDLIDAHYFYPDGVAAAWLAKWFNKPLTITARGTDLNLIPRYRLPRRMMRWAAGHANASIGVCKALVDVLESWGIDKARLHVMRNGVDLDRFRPVPRAEARASLGLNGEPLLLSVGHLVERKGHHVAIGALARLLRTHPHARLAIVGGGEEEPRLKELVEHLGVQGRVTMAGTIANTELRYWYSAADMLLLASSREGWANVLLESMACGTPVVATRIWGTPEVVNAPCAGLLVNTREVEAFEGAIRELLGALPDRNAVRLYAENFGWAGTTSAQLELFANIARPVPPRPMRDLVLGGVILTIVIYGLRHPWVGILGWTWISIMNPHAYSWRMNSIPVAAAMAGSVFLGVLLTKDRRNLFVTPESAILLAFMFWMCLTFPFSFYLSESYPMLNRVMKIDLMILMALVVLHTKRHIMLLTWVVAFSIGFYGIKGGLFVLATGGSYRVWGPAGSYIEGNNEVALALVMVIPLFRFLQLTSTNARVRRGLFVSMGLCAVAAIGSYSRGALLAIAAMTVVLWARSQKKAMGIVVLGVLAVVVLSVMPEQWWARMNTIKSYDEDSSALGRLNAWWMAWNLAKSNFFGGGYMVYTADIFARYAPDPLDIHAAHSIYFMVLGEHGFVGLALFLLLWIVVWRSAGKLRREGATLPQTQWVSHLGAMCQVSLAGYAVGGAFLSLSYYDLPYNILVIVVLAKRWMQNKGWIEEEKEEARRQAERLAKGAKKT